MDKEKAKAYNGNYKAYTELINRLEDVKEAIKKQNYGIAMDILHKHYPEYQITTSPELKESEDEKIRKYVIKVVHEWWNRCNDPSPDFPSEDKMLAYLEKQGEQKPADKVEPKFKVGDIVVVKPMACHGEIIKGKPFEIVDITEDDYISDNGKSYSISLQDGWELVKQKPVDISLDFENALIDLIRDANNDYTLAQAKRFIYEYGHGKKILNAIWREQKPAWSEEDENMQKSIIATCELAEQDRDSSPARHLLEMQADWLKSLKDRCLPQPKQEWSEEDEEMLKQAIDMVEWYGKRIIGTGMTDLCLDKSDTCP